MDELNIGEIQIDNELDGKVSHLALSHYGDTSEASRLRVTEVALESYFRWLELVKGGEKEFGEPSVDWQSGEGKPVDRLPAEIADWLFKRR